MYRKTNNSSAGFDSKQKKQKSSLKLNNHAPKQHISSTPSSFYSNHSHKSSYNNNTSSCSSNKVIHQNIKMYVNNLYNNSSSDFMQLSKTNSSDSTRSCASSTDSLQSACSNKNELNNVMGMNNFNSKTTTTSNTTIAAAASAPGTYSLDFLHYVGEQVTSGRTEFSGYKSNDDSNTKTDSQKNHKMTESTTAPAALKNDSNSSLSHQHFFVDSSHHTNSNHPNSNINNNSNNHHNYRFNQHNSYHHNNNYHTFNRNFNPHGNHQGKHRNWNNNINPGLSNGGWQSKPNKNFNNNISNSKSLTTNQNTSKTVLYSRSNRVINSRSPTPSPKSESPPIEITPNGTQNVSTSVNNCNHKVNNRQIEEIVGYNINHIPHSNNNNYNVFENDAPMLYSTNGHSNSNHNGNGPHHIIELPVSLSQINDEPFRGYYTFYGSHQNLNQLYEPNFIHKHNYSSSSSDTGLNFLTDHLDGFDSGNISKKKTSPISHPLGTIATGKFTRAGKKLGNTGYTIKGASSEFIHTPPDRFLAKSHLIQTKTPHKDLIVGSEWDTISQNIWDRFIGAQQTEETFKRKMYLWRYLFLCIKKAFPRYGLYLVGSTITGFGTDNSDVDMCLVTRYITHNDPRIEALFYLTELKNYLMNTSGLFENFHLIQAKVPILRFKDTFNALEVDLNFNNCVGIRNTHLLYCYQQMDWRLKPLAVIVKLWAQFHHINNAKNMTISSYSLVLMVIHFLQVGVSPPVLPCLHALYPDKFQKFLDLSNIDMIESMKSYTSDNRQTMGELFYRFLEYYSNFDYAQYAISVRTASVLPIEACRQARSYKNDPHQWKQLCIEEPFDLTNTARSVYDGEIFEKIKNVFVTSYKVLDETMDLNSIFTTVFLETNALSSISSSTTSTSLSGNTMASLLSMPSTISSAPSIAINAGTGCL